MESAETRIGIDLLWGGAIREIWFQGQNLINNYDGGRLLAVSFYDGTQPPASDHPNDTGWNPTPSDMYDHANPPLEFSTANNEVYLRTRYLQWFPNDKGGGNALAVPTEILAETWISFYGDPSVISLTYRITNDSDLAHAVASQEFPFAYVRTPFNNYVTYAGNQPWTRGNTIERTINVNQNALGQTKAGERWAGLVNSEGIGLVLWAPQSYGIFSYSSFANPGPPENATHYLLPMAFLEIGPGFTVETRAFLFLGDWRESRERIYGLHAGLQFADIMAPFGIIDTPVDGVMVSGVVAIDGWAIDDSGISRVDILVDGFVVGQATYGHARPDVDSHYPGLPNVPGYGLAFQLETAELPNGRHVIEVIAVDLFDNTSNLLPGQLEVEVNN